MVQDKDRITNTAKWISESSAILPLPPPFLALTEAVILKIKVSD